MKNEIQSAIRMVLIICFGSSAVFFTGCKLFQNDSEQMMVIKATNRNIATGDSPAISVNYDGTAFVELALNSSQTFSVKKSNPCLYLWTCEKGCIWKRFLVPLKIGESIDYNVADPNDRKLTFLRIK